MAVEDGAVIHRWIEANLAREPERLQRLKGSRLFSKGATLYSYREDYPIATLRLGKTCWSRPGNSFPHTAFVHPHVANWTGVPAYSHTTGRHIRVMEVTLITHDIYPVPVLTHMSYINPPAVQMRPERLDDEMTIAAGRAGHHIKRMRSEHIIDERFENALRALHHIRLCAWWQGYAPAPDKPLDITESSPNAVYEALREELWITKVRREMVA